MCSNFEVNKNEKREATEITHNIAKGNIGRKGRGDNSSNQNLINRWRGQQEDCRDENADSHITADRKQIA